MTEEQHKKADAITKRIQVVETALTNLVELDKSNRTKSLQCYYEESVEIPYSVSSSVITIVRVEYQEELDSLKKQYENL